MAYFWGSFWLKIGIFHNLGPNIGNFSTIIVEYFDIITGK
jgi:hypothetical protein